MTTDNFCFYLQDRLIQTSQTGGQCYSDTSPLVFPGPTLVSGLGLIKLFLHLCNLECLSQQCGMNDGTGNTKGGSITVLLTSCFTGLD